MRIVVDNVSCQAITGGKDNLLGKNIMKELRDYLKVRVKGYEHTKAYQNRVWDGYKPFITPKGNFATGFLPMVYNFLEELGCKIEILDKRRNLPKFGEIVDKLPNGYELTGKFSHQSELVAKCDNWLEVQGQKVYYPRGIIDAATNAGKNSICASLHLSLGKPKTLFLIHSADIFKQAVEFFGSCFDVTEVSSKKMEFGNFTIAMVKTLYKRSKESLNIAKELKKYELLIVDECFVGETLIDGKPIKDYVIGDFVNSFNHDTCLVEKREVTHVFKKESKNLCKVLFSNGLEITCTEDHPFFSLKDNKYLPVKDLLFSFVAHIEDNGKESNLPAKGLHELQKVCRDCNRQTKNTIKKKQGLLFRRMQRGCTSYTTYREWQESYKVEQRLRMGEDAHQQSYERREVQRKNENDSKSHRTSTLSKRGKRSRYRLAAVTGYSFRVGYGSHSPYKKVERWIPYTLQNRCSKRSSKSSCRGGWWESLYLKKAGRRQEEGRVFNILRVESIEIQKQGSRDGLGRLRENCTVYNLEVEGNNNYFANGVLVHNCHRSSSEEYSKLLQKVDAGARIFVSGTPLENEDKVKNMIIIGLSGRVLGKVTNQEMIDKGVSQRPIVKFLYNNTPIARELDYDTEEKQVIQRSLTQAENILNLCIERRELGKLGVISFIDIEHGEFIQKYLNDSGKLGVVEIVHGKDRNRAKKIEAFKEGKIDVLVSSMILKEGLNIPNIHYLIRAEGGKSVITSKQFVGRAIRDDKENTTVEIIDFYHGSNSKYCSEHSMKRLKTYKKEGFEIILDPSLKGIVKIKLP